MALGFRFSSIRKLLSLYYDYLVEMGGLSDLGGLLKFLVSFRPGAPLP